MSKTLLYICLSGLSNKEINYFLIGLANLVKIHTSKKKEANVAQKQGITAYLLNKNAASKLINKNRC